MRWSGLPLAGAIVLLVNAVVLARVAWNRSGDPDGTVTLTEREAPRGWSSPSTESSGVSLRLSFSRPVAGILGASLPSAFEHRGRSSSDPGDPEAFSFLDAGKLASLGFDVHLPTDQEAARRLVRHQLARRAFAVIEVGGPSWDALLRRVEARELLVERELADRKRAEEDVTSFRTSVGRLRRSGSRLFIIDVGVEAEALRRRYPDRRTHLILPAKVWPLLRGVAPGERCLPPSCHLGGAVTVLIEEVNVPRSLQASLPGSGSRPGGDPPGYEVDLAIGRNHEPWITAIRPLPATR